jgi:hypothetical protein
MFAPGHRQTAQELVRVTRPGGALAVTGWTPEGMNGLMFKTLGNHMPAPPEGIVPPAMWGDEAHIHEIFDAPGVEISCEKRMARIEFDSHDDWMEHLEQDLGPIVIAKAVLEPQGKWEAARADLEQLEESFNQADGGSFRADAEYLLTVVTVSA